MLIEVACQLVQLTLVGPQQLHRPAVLLGDQLGDLLVHPRLGLWGAGQRGIAPQVLIAYRLEGYKAKLLRHSEARASLVACSMSLEAPVVTEWNTSSSAARPPV